MKDRRTFLGALASAVISAPLSTFAQQQSPTLRRSGFLGSESASNQANRLEALRAGLRELGYVEGKNLVIEVRWADGKYDRLPALAAELVNLKVSVIVSSGAKATVAAKRATTTVPIVMESGDAVALAVLPNVARPQANIPGSPFFGPELAAKRLELLKEAMPSITQVAFLVNPADPPSSLQKLEATAKALKLALPQFPVRVAADLDSAFAEIATRRIGAVVVQGDTL